LSTLTGIRLIREEIHADQTSFFSSQASVWLQRWFDSFCFENPWKHKTRLGAKLGSLLNMMVLLQQTTPLMLKTSGQPCSQSAVYVKRPIVYWLARTLM